MCAYFRGKGCGEVTMCVHESNFFFLFFFLFFFVFFVFFVFCFLLFCQLKSGLHIFI